MTILINNELLNRLIRQGEGQAGLSALPRIEQVVGDDNKLAQEGDWVPLLDALRAVVRCAQRIQALGSESEECTVAIDRASLEQLLLAMIRLEPLQRALPEVDAHGSKDAEAAAKQRRACHAAAVDIARRLQREPRMPFERYKSLLAKAPDLAMTTRFLAQAGKPGPTLIDGHGDLTPIAAPLPATVPARTTVRLQMRVLGVDDEDSIAVVQRLQELDEASAQALEHHRAVCELRFERDSLERADLTAAHYLDVPLRISAAAECALLPTAMGRSTLTMLQVLEGRDTMDELHRQAKRFEQQLRLALE
jgi:hypothetical protein